MKDSQIEALRRKRRRVAQRDQEALEPTGLTGRWNPNGSMTASDEPGTIFVRIGATKADDKRPATKVNNAVVDTDVNLPVILKQRGGEWYVADLDVGRGRHTLGARTGNAATPRRAGDLLKETIPGRNLKPGRVRVWIPGTLKVNAEAFLYLDSNSNERLWQPTDANALDIAAQVPAASGGVSQQCWARLALNPDATTPALAVFSGTPQLITMPLAPDGYTAIAITDGYIPLDAVILVTDDASESDVPEADWAFGRRLFGGDDSDFSGDAADVSYAPTSPLTAADVQDAIDQLLALLVAGVGGGALGDHLVLQDQKPQNTSGGTFTSGARRTRDLNTKVTDTGTICSILKLAFTSGGTYEVVAGAVITGATSGATATVFDVVLTSGSWAGGDAAGTLWLNGQTGSFSSENLNVDVNTNVATIAANSVNDGQFRLLAGRYYSARIFAPAVSVEQHRAWLRNITDGADAPLLSLTAFSRGSSGHSGTSSAVLTHAMLLGEFTIAANKTFEVQHQCGVTVSSFGFGTNSGSLGTEVFTHAEFWREAA